MGVSIHAPHAGRDVTGRGQSPRRTSFNPRAPCGARRVRLHDRTQFRLVSIHAPHAGRDARHLHCRADGRVSIHAPHAGRDASSRERRSSARVSIHAPHAGRDARDRRRLIADRRFQSTRPMRGATDAREIGGDLLLVSIHAPHAGRDTAYMATI